MVLLGSPTLTLPPAIGWHWPARAPLPHIIEKEEVCRIQLVWASCRGECRGKRDSGATMRAWRGGKA